MNLSKKTIKYHPLFIFLENLLRKSLLPDPDSLLAKALQFYYKNIRTENGIY